MKEGSVRAASGGYMFRVVDMMQSPEMSPSKMASLTKRFSKGADLTGRLPMNSSRLKFSFPSPVFGGKVSMKLLGLNIAISERKFTLLPRSFINIEICYLPRSKDL